MWDYLQNNCDRLLGLNAETLSFWQVSSRAIVIYIAALIMVRLGGDRRFIGKYAAFDVTLSIMFGATLSRAINGNAPFFPTLGAGFVFVFVHWLFGVLSFYSRRFEQFIEGRSHILIQEGEINYDALRSNYISAKELESTLRQKAKITHASQVEIARLESNGDISIIPRSSPPQILEVRVEAGVQTVRIEL
ncbi:MAG: DUF421 domain-containing protein [Spirulinaceae cyanobacterium]